MSETTENAGRRPRAKRDYFSADQAGGDLRARSVRGGRNTAIAQIAKLGLSLGSTFVLARVLLPTDFGLMASVFPIIGFIGLFKDLGLSLSTVQRKTITHAEVSLLFWVNVGFSAVLAAMCLLLAGPIGAFYGDDRIAPIIRALAVTFLFGGLAAQHQALLQRGMRFLALGAVEVGSFAAGIAVAIAAGLSGWGYWSLVAMSFVTPAVAAAGYWMACGWVPGPPRKTNGAAGIFRFGGDITGFTILNYAARNADNVLIKRALGDEALGYYSRAYALLLLPLQQINAPVSAVAIPALSALQDDPVRFRRYYVRALRLVVSLAMPIVFFCMAMAPAVIRLALGDQWDASSRIFAALSVASLIQIVYTSYGWLYISLGQSRRLLIYALIACPLTVASFFIGLPFGAIGVAVAYSTISVLLLPFGTWYALRRSPVRIGDLVSAVTPALLSSGAGGVALLGFRLLAPEFSQRPLAVAIATPLFLAAWWGVQSLLPAEQRTIADYRDLLGKPSK